MKQTQYTIIQNELISKEKWKFDKDVSKCERCDKPFNVLIRRKHHCRRCGYIYCQDCSSHFLDAHHTSTEKKIRLCRKCYDYITQLISAKGFILGIEDQTINTQSKIETASHSRNASRHQENSNTFISSKSTIVKGHEISFQYEDEDNQELDQDLNQQDITEFFDQEESIKINPDTDVAKCQQLQLKEKASSQLDKICEYLLQNVLQQPAKVIEQWKFLMKHFILQCVEDLQFVSLNQDPMDINYFVKTKIIYYHDNTLTGYFKGVIFRKNVALKQMQCEIQNPTILIIIGEFDMASSQNQLEEYINNEEKTVIEYVNKISKHLNPNLILVEKGANKIALDICLKKKITVLTNVKIQVLKRIRLCTGAKFIKLQRLDQYIEKKDKILGKCLKVSFKNFPKGTMDKGGIQKDQTLCFLETADAKKFATILISGPQEDLLSKLKQCFVGCVRLGKHQDLETHFIETETKMIQSKYMQGKPILSCGNFTTYLFEKVQIKELFSSELQYQKVNYVLADIHNFNDIKDFPSLEDYKKKHPTLNARIEEFSIAKMCHMPQELKMQYQSGRDICLGHFIILKVSNKDKKCDQCKLPKNSHITFYYCGNKYVKISVDQELRGERIISTSDVPVLQGQISQSSQFSQLSNEDENNFNIVYTAKDVQKLVQQTHSNQKGEKKKIPIQTYIECSKCLEVLSNKVKLTPSNLEFSFLRFIQTLFLVPIDKQNIDKQKDNTCNHQPQRIFSYDESIVKVTVGDVDIYSIQFLRLWDDSNGQKFNAWEKQYVLDKLRELQLKFVTSVTHFSNQIKKYLLRNIPIEEIEQLQDEAKWQEVQQKITYIHQLQQLTQELGIKLLNVNDYIKSEIKKSKYPSAQKLWDNTKESIIRSTRELDTPQQNHHLSMKSDAKLNYSGKDDDMGNSNSDYLPDNDVDSVIETLGDLKSPKNRTRTPTVKTNGTQNFSVKELDSQIHSFSVQGEKLPEFNLHKEWHFSGFHNEQERIRQSQKIISYVPIFENHSISYLAFALNHPQYLQKIGYFENFTFTDEAQKKNIMKKFLVQKSEVQSWKIESQEDSLRDEQGSLMSKKEKNYITIQIQYDHEKGLKPSQSKDQLLDDELQSLPSQSQILNPSQMQVQVQKQQKKSKYLEVLVYFPHQFEALRTYCGINLSLYIKSLNTIHNWNVTGGKSTSKFYKSHNELFVVKKFDDEKEFKMFEQFACDYFDFMNRHFLKDKASLLCKILGMYEIRDKGTSEFYLVMENLYYGMGDPKDLRVYDLKGSETNRWEKKLNKVLLDTNFIVDRNAEPIPIVNHDYGYLDRAIQVILQVIQNDSKFLVNLQIIDYSLLLIIDEKQKKLRLGIIDYLRFYTWDKETEHYLKYILKGRKVPTIVNPSDYKDRFVNAAKKYFIRL